MHEDVARCGPSTSNGVPKRMVEEKKNMMMKRDVLKKEIEMMKETKRKMKEELGVEDEEDDEDEEEEEEEKESEVPKTFDPNAPGTSAPAAKPCDHSNCNCVVSCIICNRLDNSCPLSLRKSLSEIDSDRAVTQTKHGPKFLDNNGLRILNCKKNVK